jgi:hypothetical protein
LFRQKNAKNKVEIAFFFSLFSSFRMSHVEMGFGAQKEKKLLK